MSPSRLVSLVLCIALYLSAAPALAESPDTTPAPVTSETTEEWWKPGYLVDYGLIAAGAATYVVAGQIGPTERALFGPRLDPDDPAEILDPDYAGDLGRPHVDEPDRGIGETVPQEHVIFGIVGVAGLIALEEGLYWGLSDRGSARRFHDTIVGFAETMALNAGITEIAKVVVGRLRPDFQERTLRYLCQVESPESVDCTGVEPLAETDEEAEEIFEDGRKSFFSGHSSFGLAVSTYTALVIGGRWVWSDDTTPLARSLGLFAQTIAVAAGLFIAGSRLDDGRHHTTDVLVGSAVGFGLANLSYWRRFGGNGEPIKWGQKDGPRLRVGPGPGNGLALTVTY